MGTKGVESLTHDQIKHVTWDIFGKTIITLSEQGTVRFWNWRFLNLLLEILIRALYCDKSDVVAIECCRNIVREPKYCCYST